MPMEDQILQLKEDFDNVYAKGKAKEYNDFWDNFQDNGAREDYMYAFGGIGWTKATFKPKYSMTPTDATCMFFGNYAHVDLTELVSIDFSNCPNLNQLFQGSYFTKIGVVDTKAIRGDSYMFFANCYLLETIENIIIYENNCNNILWSNMFQHSTRLKNVTISGSGRICTSLNMKSQSLLTKATITNLINYLSDDVSGKTATFKTQNITNAFGSADNSEWVSLISTKPNWTISLV